MSEPLTVTLASPLAGWCAGLADNPDPVFRDRLLGDGVSIDPTVGELRAPFDGEVLTLPDSRHAINLRADNGAEILIHVGIDTVKLKGHGFEALVSPGDRVAVGQALLRFDLDRLAREALSCRTPVLLLHNADFELSALAPEGPVTFGDALFELKAVTGQTAGAAEVAEATGAGEPLTEALRIGLAHGLHARPAATLVDALTGLKAEAELITASGARGNVRSPVALMGLGLAHGDTATLRVSGRDAARALGALLPLLEPMAQAPQDRKDPQSPTAGSAGGASVPTQAPPLAGERLPGQVAAPGLAMGPACQLQAWTPPEAVQPDSAAEERSALSQAIGAVRDYLEELRTRHQGQATEVAAAHLALLDDPSLLAQAQALIDQGTSASAAWGEALAQAAAPLATLRDQRMQERVDDLQDLARQVQRVLAGEPPGAAVSLPPGAILVSDNLLPSQLLSLADGGLAGICLAAGGATSHVAILAAAQGLPMLVAAGPAVLAIEEGETVCLDAEDGAAWWIDNEAARGGFDAQMKASAQLREEAEQRAMEPGTTRDGVPIKVLANLASLAETETALAAGAEGCGLLRTEFLFMARQSAPGVDEQRAELQSISDLLGDRDLVVRTLDAGADKPLDFLAQPPEDNPALGVRGVRLSLAEPGLLTTQLEAMLRLERTQPLQVMLPMVSDLAEVHAVRSLLEDLRQAHGLTRPLALGMMIETPAAALLAESFAPHVDFFSIGTNDLTQYTLCMDRLEPRLASSLDALHPAVLRLVAHAARAGEEAGIEVGVCGAVAADRLAAPVLVGLGISKLSVPGGAIALLKAQLRQLSMSQCRDLAADALGCDSAGSVRAILRERLQAIEAENSPGDLDGTAGAANP